MAVVRKIQVNLGKHLSEMYDAHKRLFAGTKDIAGDFQENALDQERTGEQQEQIAVQAFEEMEELVRGLEAEIASQTERLSSLCTDLRETERLLQSGVSDLMSFLEGSSDDDSMNSPAEDDLMDWAAQSMDLSQKHMMREGKFDHT